MRNVVYGMTNVHQVVGSVTINIVYKISKIGFADVYMANKVLNRHKSPSLYFWFGVYYYFMGTVCINVNLH